MKLKDGFVSHELDGENIVINVKKDQFSGIIRTNETAAFIFDCLKQDTTIEEITNKLVNEYENAKYDEVYKDVEEVINKLREINALDD